MSTVCATGISSMSEILTISVYPCSAKHLEIMFPEIKFWLKPFPSIENPYFV